MPQRCARCHPESKKVLLFVAALVIASAAPSPAQNQDKGMWYAASSTANAITGDIVIKDGKITIDLRSYPLAPIRALTPAELSAVFDADQGAEPVGNLYRLFIPASTRFSHHNSLCGTEDTQWMATYAEGKALQVAFFSGPDAPKLTFEAIQNSTALCGTFGFTR